jgi:hypothetical protein
LVRLVKRGLDTRPRLSPEQIKKSKPTRNPAVLFQRQEDGTMFLEAPLSQHGRGITGWIARKMKVSDTKKFELEPVGAFLWELFDGQHTVETISRKLREAYKMNRLEADASLNAFLQMLSAKNLITLQVPTAGLTKKKK